MFRSGAAIRPHAAVFGFVFSGFRACFNPSAHKRLILIATIVLTDAATARLPLNVITSKPYLGSIFAYVFVLLIVVYDLGSRRRVHRATVWDRSIGGDRSEPSCSHRQSGFWHAFAGWVLALTRVSH